MKKLDKPTKRWLIVLIVFLVVSCFRKSDCANPLFPVAYARARKRVPWRHGRKNKPESSTINEEIF